MVQPSDDNGGAYPATRRAGVLESAGRVPPQAIEVEQAVLGAMLIEREAIPKAIEVLPGADFFYDPRHSRIYDAILGLFGKDHPVDMITVADELSRRGHLDAVGGPSFLSDLTTRVATAANVEYHARIIAEKSILRKLIDLLSSNIVRAYDPAVDAFEMLDETESEIFRISDTQLRRSARSMGSVLMETLEKLEAIHGMESGITGVPTGFRSLDAVTGGWQRSDLIIVAARPSMGKTAFALSLARNAALHRKEPCTVAIFSLEMSAQQLAQRLLTSEARVDAQAARTGRLAESDFPKLARAASRLHEGGIYIDDTPGLSILELRAKSRRLKAEHDIGLIVVDYLQLMQGPTTNRNANREQEIAQISRSLKALAKELDVPVIALSQLSRAVENRTGDHRPQLSDLRESGSIEQDADVVAFIYRAERYGIMKDEQTDASTSGMAEIIIGKQRNGPIGTVHLAFVNQYARFENLTTYYSADEEKKVKNPPQAPALPPPPPRFEDEGDDVPF